MGPASRLPPWPGSSTAPYSAPHALARARRDGARPISQQALTKQRDALDSGVKRGKLMVVEARQLADDIERVRAEHFSQELSLRSPSPLSPTLWKQIADDFPDDQAMAIWFLLLGTLTPGLAAVALAESLRSIDAVPERLDAVLSGFVVVSFAAAFMGSPGRGRRACCC
ncbi:DUF3772 domain-containing protein [Pantoea ananatis]|uniref:DUF3772 domain-containing protein n=1 Tax=Pantoea ananas TaxID=553 RepID=UPI00222125B7|nr:DUF3772 domain-containing protein [Pantoea ananatis]